MMNEGEGFCGWGWCPVGYPYVISECSRFGGVVLLLVGCFELGGGFEPGSVIGLGFALERACGVWRVDRRLLCLLAASDKKPNVFVYRTRSTGLPAVSGPLASLDDKQARILVVCLIFLHNHRARRGC